MKLLQFVSTNPFLAVNDQLRFLESFAIKLPKGVDRLSLHSKAAPAMNRQTELARGALSSLVELFRSTSTDTSRHPFFHVDIILKRESRSEVSLLLDLKRVPISTKMRSFLLVQLDANVVRAPSLNRAHFFQPRLNFLSLSDSVANNEPISTHCEVCGGQTDFSPRHCSPVFACSKCPLIATPPPIEPNDFHLRRMYCGPPAPSLANVWLGVVEKFAHKNSSRVGIVGAKLYRLVRGGDEGKTKLPGPDARLQWVIRPIG